MSRPTYGRAKTYRPPVPVTRKIDEIVRNITRLAACDQQPGEPLPCSKVLIREQNHIFAIGMTTSFLIRGVSGCNPGPSIPKERSNNQFQCLLFR